MEVPAGVLIRVGGSIENGCKGVVVCCVNDCHAIFVTNGTVGIVYEVLERSDEINRRR